MVLHPPGWASNDADVDGDGLPEVFPDGHLERADHALLSSGLDLQGLCDGAWLGRVVAGVDLRYQRAYDAGYASNDEGGLYRSATADHDGLSFPDVDRVFLAPYLQWERALAGWASVTIGARYDVYQDFGSELSLRGGLVVRPASDTTVKLLGATAFRAPTLFELHSPHRERLGNPDLDAEAIRTVEVQVAQRLLDHYELRLAGYHLDMDNRIDVPLVTAIEGRSAYLNHPGTTGWGGDVELRALWPGGSWLSVGGAWHRTTDTETDERLARVAPWSADVGGSVHVYGGLHAGGGLRYRSARQPPAFSYFQRTWLRGHDEPARLMLDLTLRAEDLPAGVSLRASAQNVLGTPWREVPEDVTMSLRSGPDGPENLPGEPRTFLVELAHHF